MIMARSAQAGGPKIAEVGLGTRFCIDQSMRYGLYAHIAPDAVSFVPAEDAQFPRWSRRYGRSCCDVGRESVPCFSDRPA